MAESARYPSLSRERDGRPASAESLGSSRRRQVDGERLHGLPAAWEQRRAGPLPPEPLWRQVLGERLRVMRLSRGETLAETADRAGISPQYLSEIERGRKEPSSELIAAVAGALDTTLLGLTEQVAGDLRRQQAAVAPRASTPRAFTPRASVLALAA